MAIVNEQKLTVNKQAILIDTSLFFPSHRSPCRTDIEHDRNERIAKWRKRERAEKEESACAIDIHYACLYMMIESSSLEKHSDSIRVDQVDPLIIHQSNDQLPSFVSSLTQRIERRSH